MQGTPDKTTGTLDTDVSHADVATVERAAVAAQPGHAETAARSSEGKTEEASLEPGAVSPAHNWMLPLAVVVIGMFMSVLDTSIVNVAIPTMQKEFNVTSNDIEWVSTAYTLCLGVVVPTSAWLGERIGLRRLYLITLLGFAGFSAMCGLSGNLGVLIFFRVLQAVPAGVIPVTCLTILYRIVPREQLGAAMSLYSFGLVVAPGIGPLLGGYLVEYVNWRLIFYINVPIGIVGAIGAMLVVPRFPGVSGRKFDVPGFVCIAVGLVALLLAVSEGQIWGWSSYSVLILLVASVNLLGLFVGIEMMVKQPLLDVRVFRYRPFINSLILITILTVDLFAVLYYVPQFLQNGQGITPMNTGLVVLPQALAMMVVIPFSGRLYDRFGARWPAVAGLALTAAGIWMMAQINIDATRPEIIMWTTVLGAGAALCISPILTAGLSSLPNEINNFGSAYNTLFQRVSSALGLSALTALTAMLQTQDNADRSALLSDVGANINPQIAAMQQHGPGGLISLWQQLHAEVFAQSYSTTFLVITALTVLSIPLAFLLPSGRPAREESVGPVEF